MIIASERGLNKFVYSLPKRKKIDIEFPHDRSSFSTTGYWSGKNYILMDIFGCMWLNSMYDNYYDLRRESPCYVTKLNNLVLEQDKFDTLYQSWIHDKFNSSLWEAEISDPFLRKRYPFFSKLTSQKIYELIHTTSTTSFRLAYHVKIKNGNPKETQFEKFSNLSEGKYVNFFNYNIIEEVKDSKDRIINRSYRISFNTILGHVFLMNLLNGNIDWYDSTLWNLNENSQLLYRHSILHKNIKKGRGKGDIELIWDIDKLLSCMGYTEKQYYNYTDKVIECSLVELKEHGFIENYCIENKEVRIKVQSKKVEL